MSRAVGAQRGHLVKSFIVEGMAYSLLAGFIGVAAGVAASYGMTEGLLKTAGGDYFSLIEPKITGTSLVIGYSLGVVITFLTVVFASMKVSHVNIVSAIRDSAQTGRIGDGKIFVLDLMAVTRIRTGETGAAAL